MIALELALQRACRWLRSQCELSKWFWLQRELAP
jgi:hypothetical protein